MLVDDNGNLTDDATRALVWDAFNRLVAVARKSDGAAIAAYSYLPDGRRSRKVVFSQTNPGVVEREVRFAWDGAQEVEEQNAAGVTLATFVWSPVYVDDLVEFRREAAHPLGAGSFYAHQDVRCDVVAVTNASGVVVEKRRYDDFGREEIRDAGGAVVAASPSGLEYGFQGRRRDPETGWLYFRARFYDPETGRFLSRDPVWDAGNVGGWYTFVGNGPLSGRDPSGLMDEKVRDAAAKLKIGEMTEAEMGQLRIRSADYPELKPYMEAAEEVHSLRQQKVKLEEQRDKLYKASQEARAEIKKQGKLLKEARSLGLDDQVKDLMDSRLQLAKEKGAADDAIRKVENSLECLEDNIGEARKRMAKAARQIPPAIRKHVTGAVGRVLKGALILASVIGVYEMTKAAKDAEKYLATLGHTSKLVKEGKWSEVDRFATQHGGKVQDDLLNFYKETKINPLGGTAVENERVFGSAVEDMREFAQRVLRAEQGEQ